MALIAWNDSYRVNVAEIDAQHRELVALVNRLHQAMREEEDGGPVLRSLVTELLAFTEAHFATEENLMAAYDYPGTAQHKAEHAALLKEMTDFAEGIRQGDALLTLAIVLDAKRWVVSHIVTSDKALGVYLNRKDVY